LKVPMSEVKKHNKETDAWVIFNGRVYNVTQYLEYHPGGKAILMKAAGKDATKLFYATHRWVNGEHLLRTCLIGTLVPDEVTQSSQHEEKDEVEEEKTQTTEEKSE